MKNIFLVMSFLSTFLLNSMDQAQDFAFRVNGTIIQVNKQSIHDVDGTVGVIVTSFDKQLFLSDSMYRFRTAEVRRVRDNILKIDVGQERKMKSTAIVVAEPIYNTKPAVTSCYQQMGCGIEVSEDEQKEQRTRLIQELASCYESVFSKIAEIDELKENRTIAIEELGEFVGFPSVDIASVALKATIDFANLNPKTYTEIHLLVKKDSDVAVYKNWIDQYMAELKQKQQ